MYQFTHATDAVCVSLSPTILITCIVCASYAKQKVNISARFWHKILAKQKKKISSDGVTKHSMKL